MKNEKKNDKAQPQNKRQQQPSELNEQQNGTSAQKGMNREAEDELLTTGGPVDRSAVEDDRGSIDAQTGGMSMRDEEANPSKDDFVQGKVKRKKGRSARYGKPEQGIHPTANHHEDIDTSQDKTEGITNPRTTLQDWQKFKNYSGSSGEKNRNSSDDIKNRGKNKNDDTGKEFNDIAPV